MWTFVVWDFVVWDFVVWDFVDGDLLDCDLADGERVDCVFREETFPDRDLLADVRDLLVGALSIAEVLDTDFVLPADFAFTAGPALADVFFEDDFADPLAAFRLNRRCTLLISWMSSSFFIPCQPGTP